MKILLKLDAYDENTDFQGYTYGDEDRIMAYDIKKDLFINACYDEMERMPEFGDTKKFIFNITDILEVKHIKGGDEYESE